MPEALAFEIVKQSSENPTSPKGLGVENGPIAPPQIFICNHCPRRDVDWWHKFDINHFLQGDIDPAVYSSVVFGPVVDTVFKHTNVIANIFR